MSTNRRRFAKLRRTLTTWLAIGDSERPTDPHFAQMVAVDSLLPGWGLDEPARPPARTTEHEAIDAVAASRR